MRAIAREMAGMGVLVLSLLGFSIPASADDDCECNCSAYQSLLEHLARDQASQASLVERCAPACAIAWERCEAGTDPESIAAGSNEAQDEQAISDLLDRFLIGASTGDSDMHERFWSDELVYTSSAGLRFGKPELMAGLTSSVPDDGPTPVYSADHVRIRWFDELALLDFTLVARHSDQTEQRFLNSGVFRREGDQWRVISWHATSKTGP